MNAEYRAAVLANPAALCAYPGLHNLGDCVWCDAYYEENNMRDWRHTSEALDDIPLKEVNLNKLGLQPGPQHPDYHFGHDALPEPLWDRVVAWFRRHR